MCGSVDTNIISPYIDFRTSPELVTLGASVNHLFQGEVHPSIAVDQMAVESFPIF